MNPRTARGGQFGRQPVVADFHGDGRADVAISTIAGFGLWGWQVSWRGTVAWVALPVDNASPYRALAVGRFDDLPGADVLMWEHANGLVIDIVPSGWRATQRYSGQ